MTKALGMAVGLTLALVAPSALAQDNPPAGGTGTAQAGGTVETPPAQPPKVTVAAPAPAAAKEDKDDGVTDHEKVVGHFAVGYMGVTDLPLGTGPANAAPAGRTTVSTPVIGIRYWLNPRIGIDAGLGIVVTSESAEAQNGNVNTSVDGPALNGGLLHGGLPIALNTGKHYTFQLVPELNVGVASRTEKFSGTNAPPDLKHTGFRLDAGARVGAEIHFGFIGVPELALQASVGLYISRQAWKNSQDSGNGVPNNLSSSYGTTALSTNVQSNPWAIFTNNISALYYF